MIEKAISKRRMKKVNWQEYAFEFLSIFIAVISAFALENWNDNRRDSRAETKILTEISNGLKRDITDAQLNVIGHKAGMTACRFWRNVLNNRSVNTDSTQYHYLNLTRSFISIQNVSGYETLKSKGLELVQNDSLRFEIISLYEYDFSVLQKLEEEYAEMQFHQNYFMEFNQLVAPNFIFNEKGMISSINIPLNLSAAEKNTLLSYLWKIEVNRQFILFYYADIESKIQKLIKNIEGETNDR